MDKSFAVLGLGKSGRAIARELAVNGAEVIAADKSEELVNSVADEVTAAMIADLTSAEAIKGLGISNVDVVIVTMALSLEASIMCVMVAKELGVPHVVAKAKSERMGEILRKVGADEIVFPEKEAGQALSRKLLSDDFLDYFDISADLCIIEMKPKKDWIGKSLIQLDLRKKYDINVAAITVDGKMKASIDPQMLLTEECTLLIITSKKNYKKLI